ncbi:Helicase [Caligus rogercresseyi]|uniref:Helicase n=1 Tax=Caligus rogercresseyi TaxID=217165 RepID=A0A7T8JXR3_CALRO|nr:Helicase [Caligus rogercresseyi]
MQTENSVFRPYQFKLEELDGFRYRARDAMRGVTRIAIREARLKELKHEILKSVELRAHFEDNPQDAQVLRHDKSLHTVKHQVHMKNVPDYIVPKALKNIARSHHRNL